MPEHSEAVPVTAVEQSTARRKSGRPIERAAAFVVGAQKLMLEELIFAGTAFVERAQTETHLFGEFVSKLGAAHSVQDMADDGQRMRSASARIRPARLRSDAQAWGAIDRGDFKLVEQSAIAPPQTRKIQSKCAA